MPRKMRRVRERARAMREAQERGEYVAKTPGGKVLRNQAKAHIRDIARLYTEFGIEELVSLIKRKTTKDDHKLAAIGMLFERGWGKPAQSVVAPDGASDPLINHRHHHIHEVQRTIVRPQHSSQGELGRVDDSNVISLPRSEYSTKAKDS